MATRQVTDIFLCSICAHMHLLKLYIYLCCDAVAQQHTFFRTRIYTDDLLIHLFIRAALIINAQLERTSFVIYFYMNCKSLFIYKIFASARAFTIYYIVCGYDDNGGGACKFYKNGHLCIQSEAHANKQNPFAYKLIITPSITCGVQISFHISF